MLMGTLPPRSNRASWTDVIELTDEDTGDLIDVSTGINEITVRLRDPETRAEVLSKALSASEIVVISTGIVQFSFSSSEMGSLCPKTYELGCLVTSSEGIEQIFLGRVPVLEGL